MSDASIPRADELLLIGTVVNVVGLRGMVRMSVASSEPEFLARTQPMLYSHDGKRSFRLRSLTHYKGTLYTATLGGIATRDQADALRSTDLYIMQKDAAPLGADEYFIHDLPGIAVYDVAGTLIGTRTGMDDALVPMVKAFVQHIDIANKRIVITPIPGLLDA
jgi:16S rRNA processing protein RimM